MRWINERKCDKKNVFEDVTQTFLFSLFINKRSSYWATIDSTIKISGSETIRLTGQAVRRFFIWLIQNQIERVWEAIFLAISYLTHEMNGKWHVASFRFKVKCWPKLCVAFGMQTRLNGSKWKNNKTINSPVNIQHGDTFNVLQTKSQCSESENAPLFFFSSFSFQIL